jgi:hypothetical protein
MVYYSQKDYSFVKFEKSKRKDKMYDGILINKKTKRKVRVPFGYTKMGNYQDKTGLNAYPHLVHGDEKRRKAFKVRHKGFLKKGYFSPGRFSYYILW